MSTTSTYEFPLKSKFSGTEEFEVHINRAQKMKVFRNFITFFGAGIAVTVIGSIPFVQQYFLPFVIEQRTLGEWISSIAITVLMFTAVSGVRIDLTRIFERNREEERSKRYNFEYDVLEVVRENLPVANNWSAHMLNGLTYHGNAAWYENRNGDAYDYSLTLTKSTVKVEINHRNSKPTLVKS